MAATQKPSYLGLLNALAIAETAAEPIFDAWADQTKDAELAAALRFVGMREGEHGKAFAKRMLELGYEVRGADMAAKRNASAVKVAGSKKLSDLEKFAALGFGKGPQKVDVFDGMFQDKTIDPVTGGLLGRYIAEERDSTRLLAAQHRRIKKAAKLAAKQKSGKKGAKQKKAA